MKYLAAESQWLVVKSCFQLPYCFFHQRDLETRVFSKYLDLPHWLLHQKDLETWHNFNFRTGSFIKELWKLGYFPDIFNKKLELSRRAGGTINIIEMVSLQLGISKSCDNGSL